MATDAVFRKFPDGQVIAVFPRDLWDHQGLYVSSYMHTGQHGACSPFIARDTKPATPAEYSGLLAELVSIGYDDLRIKKRIRSV